MMAIMELSRGHGESQMKSERVGAAWSQRRQRAREGQLLTRKLPSWIEEGDGRLKLIPDRASIIRQVFKWAASGYGLSRILQHLESAGTPAFGTSGKWTRGHLANILRDRRVLGECQLLKHGAKDGEPLMGYFPRVIQEREWHLARAGAAKRRVPKGPTGKFVSLFAGLIKDARTGQPYYVARRKTIRVLATASSIKGHGDGSFSFPLTAFERTVLQALKEVDPQEILPGERVDDKEATLKAELAHVQEQLSAIQEELLKGHSPRLFDICRQLERQEQQLTTELAGAQENKARPASKDFAMSKQLLKILDNAPDPDDVRLRLRSVLRRLISEIWLLVVPAGSQGRERFAVVQIFFAGRDTHRVYVIHHRPGVANGASRKDPITEGHSMPIKWQGHTWDLRDKQAALELAEVVQGLADGSWQVKIT
jgi:hypothetical protein